MCVLLLVDAAARRAEAASYNVGNSAGWDLSADLPSWANGKTFYVGDVLGTRNPPAAVQSLFPSQLVRSECRKPTASLIVTRSAHGVLLP